MISRPLLYLFPFLYGSFLPFVKVAAREANLRLLQAKEWEESGYKEQRGSSWKPDWVEHVNQLRSRQLTYLRQEVRPDCRREITLLQQRVLFYQREIRRMKKERKKSLRKAKALFQGAQACRNRLDREKKSGQLSLVATELEQSYHYALQLQENCNHMASFFQRRFLHYQERLEDKLSLLNQWQQQELLAKKLIKSYQSPLSDAWRQQAIYQLVQELFSSPYQPQKRLEEEKQRATQELRAMLFDMKKWTLMSNSPLKIQELAQLVVLFEMGSIEKKTSKGR